MPLRRFSCLRPVPRCCSKAAPLRPDTAKCRVPSVFAVSHDSDGLLRMQAHRFVSPCIRPWSSGGFAPSLAVAVSPHQPLLWSLPAPAFIPSEVFPSQTATVRHRTAFPSRRCAAPPFPVMPRPTSGRCSVHESVVGPGVAAALDPILPWALVLFKVLPSSRVLR